MKAAESQAAPERSETTRSAPVAATTTAAGAEAQIGVAQATNGAASQRREALRLANEVRSRRAQLKRELGSGLVSPAEIVCETPEWMATATAALVLESSRRIGPVKAARILRRAGISPTRQLGSLSSAERQQLVFAIATRGGRR